MSWEENEEFLPQEHQAPSARSAPALNPNAFSFNPGASTFTPSFAAAPTAPSATPQPPAPTVLQSASASTPHQPASALPMAMSANSHINSNGVAPMDEDGPAEVAGSSTREEVGKLAASSFRQIFHDYELFCMVGTAGSSEMAIFPGLLKYIKNG